jgi:integrase
MLDLMVVLSFVLTIGAGLGCGIALDRPSVVLQRGREFAHGHAHYVGLGNSELDAEGGDGFFIARGKPNLETLNHAGHFFIVKGVQTGDNVARKVLPVTANTVLFQNPELDSQASSQHTLGHQNCPACEGFRAIIMQSEEFGRLDFKTASSIYLDSRKGKIGDRTHKEYVHYAESLNEFFGDMVLTTIGIDNVLAYQKERREQIRRTPQHQFAKQKLGITGNDRTDGASRINHEINCVLRQVLGRAGAWSEIEKYYEPLPVPKDGPGIALTAEEERHLFEIAQSRPRWMLAYCCSLLSRCTTAGPGEIRHLRIGSVKLEARSIVIEEGTKNDFRIRALPLNDAGLFAVTWLLDRYRKLMQRDGIKESSEHYLLPHRAEVRGGAIDPQRPMGSWKRAFYALRAEAGKKYPRLTTVRRYDFRHTACTLMLEDSTVSYSTIEKLMGHKIGSRTKQRYDHIRDTTLRTAVEILNVKHPITANGDEKTAAISSPRKPVRPALKPASGTASMYFRV